MYEEDQGKIYLQQYAKAFAENRMGRKIELMLVKLNLFIDWSAKNLALVKAEESSFYNKTLFVLRSETVHRFYSRSLDAAKKDLAKYKAYHRFIVNMTQLMEPSGIGFIGSLKEQGIPESAAVELYPLVKDYWVSTYGAVRDKFINISLHLSEMVKYLEEQINTEEQLEEVNFSEGFNKATHLNLTFKKELKAFKDLVTAVEGAMPNTKEVKGMLKAQIRLLKEDLKVHYSKERKKLTIAGETKNKTLKIVMVLMFLLGVYNLYRGMKTKVVKKGLIHGLTIALTKKGIDPSERTASKVRTLLGEVVSREVPNPALITSTFNQLGALESFL
jgi:hypothetical protein